MLEIYFNGEFHSEVPMHVTVKDVERRFHDDLTEQGYDMSGDYAVLSVQFVDGEFQVWYQ